MKPTQQQLLGAHLPGRAVHLKQTVYYVNGIGTTRYTVIRGACGVTSGTFTTNPRDVLCKRCFRTRAFRELPE